MRSKKEIENAVNNLLLAVQDHEKQIKQLQTHIVILHATNNILKSKGLVPDAEIKKELEKIKSDVDKNTPVLEGMRKGSTAAGK